MSSSTMITISVPLTRADRQKAQAFKDLQQNSETANQIYQNTLAVLAAHHYLEMLDIPTDPEKSRSHNPSVFLQSNVADLYLPEAKGWLECRAVRASEPTCFIPGEVWKSDRGNQIGYIVMRLNETNTEATILGFVPEVTVERLPLSYLQSLEKLVDRIYDFSDSLININDLAKGLLATGWERIHRLTRRPIVLMASVSQGDVPDDKEIKYLVETFYAEDNRSLSKHKNTFNDFSPQDALVDLIQTTESDQIRFKAAELLLQIAPDHPNSPIVTKRDIGMLLQKHAIDLIVCVLSKPDGNYLICARVESRDRTLRGDLTLMGINRESENTNVFFQETKSLTNGEDLHIQGLFIVHPGDLFSLKVSLNDAQITENFIV